MIAVRRGGLLIALLVLTACATPAPITTPPTSAPTPRALPQAVQAASADRVELAAGRYQLIMFYSPI